MTPEEAEIIRDIFDRIRSMGPAPRDAEARAAVERALRADPDAAIGLVRAIVALDRERAALIEENRALREDLAGAGAGAQGGLFGDDPGAWRRGGRDAGWQREEPGDRYGGGWREPERDSYREPERQPWGSPPWGSSRRLPQDQSAPPVPSGPWGSRAPETGGGGLLSTALGAATGMAGGLFAYEALKGLFGGSNHAGGDGGLFGGSAQASERGGESSGTDKFVTGGDMDQGGDFFGFFDDGDEL